MRRTCGSWGRGRAHTRTGPGTSSPPPPQPRAAARPSGRATRGGGRARIDLDEALLVGDEPRHDLLDLDELLDQLAGADPRAAELVKLRFFAGLTGDEAAEVL